MRQFLRGFLVLWVLLGAIGQARSQYVYYSEAITGKIWRANLDGSGQTPVLEGLRGPVGPSVDLAGGKVYWSEGPIGVIRRANVDGSSPEDLVSGLPMGDFTLMAPSLDLVRAQMYWPVGTSQGTIGRANLDGSGPTNLIDGLNNPRGVALHLAAGKIYWANRFSGDIRRANLDGSGQEILLRDLSGPQVVALDIVAGKIYWGDYIDRQILRANLDGTGKEVVVPVIGGLPPGAGPVGITLDVEGGQVYWTDIDLSGPNGDIRRASIDGTGQEILVRGLAGPAWIALDHGGPGAAVSFAIVAASANVPPGMPFDITVTALDPYGNIDTTYQGTVTFTTTDPDSGILLPPDYAFTTGAGGDNGVHTFSGGVTLVTLGDQTLTVTDNVSSITGSLTITVGPGP